MLKCEQCGKNPAVYRTPYGGKMLYVCNDCYDELALPPDVIMEEDAPQ